MHRALEVVFKEQNSWHLACDWGLWGRMEVGKCWKNEYLTLLEENNEMMMPRLGSWVKGKVCLQWVRPAVSVGWGARVGGDLAFEGVAIQREWTKSSSWRELERGVPRAFGKGHRTPLHQKEKKRRKERGRARSSAPGEAQEGEEPQGQRGSLCTGWETSSVLGILRKTGQSLSLKSPRRICTAAVGKQLGIKKQETKDWWGVVRSQLRADNRTLQWAYSGPFPRTSLTV